MPQRVLERTLLGRHLRSDVQVLHLAAAAGAEVRTARHDALRALVPQRGQSALLPVVLAPVHVDLHLFAGQRAVDEDDLAGGVVSHALGFEVERLDRQPLFLDGGLAGPLDHVCHRRIIGARHRGPLLHSAASGESFSRSRPARPWRAAEGVERSGKRTGKRFGNEAFLAGERPAPSGSTEGASRRP